MKISEMSTKQAAACLCKIAAHVGRIGDDKMVNAYLKGLSKKKGSTVLQLAAGAVSELLPVLLDTHFDDTVEVLSALTGKEKSVIEQQSILVTMRDAKSVVDKDLIDFFTASADADTER